MKDSTMRQLLCALFFLTLFSTFGLASNASSDIGSTVTYEQFYLKDTNVNNTFAFNGNYYFVVNDPYGRPFSIIEFDGTTYETIAPVIDGGISNCAIAFDSVLNKLVAAYTVNSESIELFTYDGTSWRPLTSFEAPSYTTFIYTYSLDGNPGFSIQNYNNTEHFALYNNGLEWVRPDSYPNFTQFKPASNYTTIPRSLGNVSSIDFVDYDSTTDTRSLHFKNKAIYSSTDFIHWTYEGVEQFDDTTYLGNDYYLVASNDDPYFKIAKSTNEYEWTIVGDFIKTCTINDEVFDVKNNQEIRHFTSDTTYIPWYYNLGFAEMFEIDGYYYLAFRYGTGFDATSGNYLIQSTDLTTWSYVDEFNQPDNYTYKGNDRMATHFGAPIQLDNGLFIDYGSYGFFAKSDNLFDWEVLTNMRTASDSAAYVDAYLIDGVYHLITLANEGFNLITTSDFSKTNKTHIDLPKGGYFYKSGSSYGYMSDSVLYTSKDLIHWSEYIASNSFIAGNDQYYLEGNQHLVLKRTPGSNIIIKYNDSTMALQAPPILVDSRTLIPVRDVTENFGFDVVWDGTDQSITLSKGTTSIAMKIGDANVTVDGLTSTIDVAPDIINSKTYIPLRFISEVLEKTIEWDGELRTVSITD